MKYVVDSLSFKWEGSKYKPQHIHCLLLKEISPMPWPIRVLGVEDFQRNVTFIRKDVGLHLWWILAIVWYRLFYNPRWNPNSIVNIICTKGLSLWWKLSLKYRYHNNVKTYNEHYESNYSHRKRK
jgi:hypothetical protein